MKSGGNNFIDFPKKSTDTPAEGVCIKATSGGVNLSQGVYTPPLGGLHKSVVVMSSDAFLSQKRNPARVALD